MSINITPKEFQRRMIGAANRHHAAMQGMTDNEAASEGIVEAAVVAFGVYARAWAAPRFPRSRRHPAATSRCAPPEPELETRGGKS
jgi:hypothetical protein